MLRIQRLLMETAMRWLADDTDSHAEGAEGGEDHSEFGVHLSFQDLYHSVLFFTTIYVSGFISARIFKMPSLVGEIICGILLGPPLADFVPNPEAFVMLGEVGLILLVLEAGIDVNMTTLKLIGTRGVLIAIVGSILPIAIGMAIAFAIKTDTKGAIAAGAAFGPTSLGIAMNVLRQGKIVNTPVGQLIISAAVIDDMIALVVLSQLEALTGEITASSVLIPIVSALAYLILGGYIAIAIMPKLINKYILIRAPEQYHAMVELALMFGFLIALMPATYYCKASFLMGAFISGLAFCRSHGLHLLFVSQFKRLLQWLMRIFFAASIGFQVPIKDFGNGTVIWQGLLFTLALTGKLAVGFMVPNFNQIKRFTGVHFRDCLITGFSMAAEGEFAFVIAVFAVDQDLISKDLYASIVLAVLLSTIIPPFLLRFTINYYNKKAEELVRQAAEDELQRKIEKDLEAGKEEMTPEEKEHRLWETIKNRQSLFLCIQTQSDAQWGLMHKLMSAMNKKGLEIIDHRSWHPRGVNTTLVNEVYAKDTFVPKMEHTNESIEDRMNEIKMALESVMPSGAKVKVQRWYPGVVEEIVEEVTERVRSKSNGRRLNVSELLLSEASDALEKHREKQTSVTKERTVEEILKDVTLPEPSLATGNLNSGRRARPRRRQKMRSTPVVGGGLFGETDRSSHHGTAHRDQSSSFFGDTPGETAELIVDGESYQVRVTKQTIANVQKGYRGEMIEDSGIEVAAATPIVNRLQGYVRYPTPLGRIDENTSDAQSETTDGDEESSKHH